MEVTIALPLGPDPAAWSRAEQLTRELLGWESPRPRIAWLAVNDSRASCPFTPDAPTGWEPGSIKLAVPTERVSSGVGALGDCRGRYHVVWVGSPFYPVQAIRWMSEATTRFDFVRAVAGQGLLRKWNRRLARLPGLRVAWLPWLHEPQLWSAVPEFLDQVPAHLSWQRWESWAREWGFRHGRITLEPNAIEAQWREPWNERPRARAA